MSAKGTNKSHKTGDKRMLALYGKMKQLIWVSHNLADIPRTSTHVIMKTDRGLEIGKIVGLAAYKSGHFRWDPERVSSYYEEQNPGDIIADDGELIRIATHEDISEWRHLEASTKGEIETCEKIVKEMGLDMKVVEAEHIFGGERIIFYFTADGRVDFRELVKSLAKEFQTRIEMRQIGARDEAMILCDYESCGQQCCCARYLKVLKPVNMRMAKLQKATLDPSKISGYCGRLKCCLRYEDETYKHLRRKLPNRGLWVKTSEGIGQIVDTQVLTQLVVIRGSDGNQFAVNVDEIEIIDKPKSADQKSQDKSVDKKNDENNTKIEKPADEQEKAEEKLNEKKDQAPRVEIDKSNQRQGAGSDSVESDKSNANQKHSHGKNRNKRGKRSRRKRKGRRTNKNDNPGNNKNQGNKEQGKPNES